jgi:hypothetical protein
MSGPDRETGREVAFRLEPGDFDAYWRLWARAHRRHAAYVATFFSAAGAGLGTLAWALAGVPLAPAAGIGGILGLAAVLGMIRSSRRRAVEQARLAGWFEDRTLTIDPEGCEQTFRDGRRSYFPWDRVRRVGRTSTEFVIVLGDQEAVFVPLRAFGSESLADRFMQAARTWHSEATAGGQPEP